MFDAKVVAGHDAQLAVQNQQRLTHRIDDALSVSRRSGDRKLGLFARADIYQGRD